ncbi:MAG: hypothetical protein O2894_11270, partial [Planctomycetota bacterium]|nr:hypothetical protein [Planctomycetota bacterium]
MPWVPEDPTDGGPPFWLAVGEDAARALAAHGQEFLGASAPLIEQVGDIYEALERVASRRTLGCIVSGSLLDGRPRQALKNLRRSVRPSPMMVYPGREDTPQVRAVARELGITVWRAADRAPIALGAS